MFCSGSQLANAPFLRLLLPLCLGVCLPQPGILAFQPVLLILFGIVWIFLFVFRNCSFYVQPVWGCLLFFAIFMFGQARALQNGMIFPELLHRQYFVVLDDYPLEKEKTFQVVCQFVNLEPKMIAYLPKSPAAANARPGDVFCFEGKPELIENDGNPFEFDYRRYLNNRGIGYRIFLKESRYHFIGGVRQMNLYREALIIRHKMIECLSSSGIDSRNVHLIGSISFGARDEVDKETIQSFTNTGVIHVLAVSGMNVGFIYIILDFLFRFLKLYRAGHILYLLIMLLGIWSYTLITGMSASILRAATMFTFVLIGAVLRRNSGIYNSLAVSAFLLILLDPSIIRDVGFQLSYAAVLSIVAIQPFIYKQIRFNYFLTDKIWLMVSVTLSAQIGTIPLTLHYFHQFPVYFLLANLAVIPLVTLILYLSFAVVFLALVSGFLASIVALFLNWSVMLVQLTVNFVESLPHAVLRGLYPTRFQLFLVIWMVFCLFMFVRIRKPTLLHIFFASAIVLSISAGQCAYLRQSRSEIIFFNIPGTRALALTNANESIVLYDHCENDVGKLSYYMKPYFGERQIEKVETFRLSDSLRISSRDVNVVGAFIAFKGFRLFIQPLVESDHPIADQSLCSDLVWMNNPVGPRHHLQDWPLSATVLCCGADKEDTLQTNNPLQKVLRMKKSVLLLIPPSTQGSEAKIVCDYFDKAD